MNLLTDEWVPVAHQGQFKHVSLKDILCREEDWQISCPRDDFELATLQLLICLTQVLFTPRDAQELKARHAQVLDEAEYLLGIDQYLDWFDLLHPTHPFMQIRGVKAEKITPIQKLLIGLPEGNNHAFFNNAGEVKCIGLNYAAIALFHQASNCPGFGGGFKDGLRGKTPLSTFIKGNSLRTTIWLNILHEQYLLAKEYPKTNLPVWIELIKDRQKIFPHQISLLSGLFWQPAHIELQITEGNLKCQISGLPIQKGILGFNKEKFANYKVESIWRHPHSPLLWFEKKGQIEKKYASFTTTAPAWTQLSQFVLTVEEKKEGYSPALTISQFYEVFPSKQLSLIIGGYRNKQASILERRHELLSLSEGWETQGKTIQIIIELALNIKKTLRNQLYGFGKNIGIEGLADQGESLFYQRTESMIHQLFRTMKWSEARETKKILAKQLIEIALAIFEDVTHPYQHEPKMIKAFVTSKNSLRNYLFKSQKEEAA